tara:strand:+ start:738 stop:956 length:219 start_codon:yes stop_codon:yes gene_type:complete
MHNKNKSTKDKKMKKINDPLGFQKAINFEKLDALLDDPETFEQLSNMFNVNNETPQATYKKAVNQLKRKIKK